MIYKIHPRCRELAWGTDWQYIPRDTSACDKKGRSSFRETRCVPNGTKLSRIIVVQ